MEKIDFKIYKHFLEYAGGSSYPKTKLAKQKIVDKMKISKLRLGQILNGNLQNVKFCEMVMLANIFGVELKELYENKNAKREA